MELLSALLLGRFLGGGVGGRLFGRVGLVGLEQLQVLVVEERRRAAVDFEPVGTNEILLVEHRVVRTHELEVSHLFHSKTFQSKRSANLLNQAVDFNRISCYYRSIDSS